jgi:hypothetical protein
MRSEIGIAIVNVYIIFGMIIRIMDIIIFIDSFQNIVMLVQEVIGDVLAYFSFLILWVVVFAFFYQVLGTSIGEKHNNTGSAILGYISGAWDIST